MEIYFCSRHAAYHLGHNKFLSGDDIVAREKQFGSLVPKQDQIGE